MEKKYDRKDRNEALEVQIKEIRKDNPNYGYRRIHAMLRKLGILIKKKKVQRRTSSYKVYTQIKKYYSYKGTVGKVAPMETFFGILKQEL